MPRLPVGQSVCDNNQKAIKWQRRKRVTKVKDMKQDSEAPRCRIMVKSDHDQDLEEVWSQGIGTLATWHSRYSIGNVQPEESYDEYMSNVTDESAVVEIYMYDHSGLAFSTAPFSCPWDSGRLGVWVVTPDELRAEYGDDTPESRSKAERFIRSRIETMNDICQGNAWGYEVLDFDGEVCDSCWGFIGDTAKEQMAEYLPENLHDDLERAWERRHD